jgi:fructose-1,6-bisphosphatase/inositol monophosphatase family enzyme
MMTNSPAFNASFISHKLIELMLDLYPLIARHWGDRSVAELKPDKSWVTSVDKHVEAELKIVFNTLLPEAYFLGEETHPKTPAQEQELLKHELVIVVDPIDGTREYVNGQKEFGSIIGICRRKAETLIPIYGFAYRPILSDSLNKESRGMMIYTDSAGVTKLTLSVNASGEIDRTIHALSEMPRKTGLPRVVSPRATSKLVPEQFEILTSSSSVVDLLQPSLGSAEAAISKSRFWDIAGPVAIARALNFPIWRLSTRVELNGFVTDDFVQDHAEYKWQLKEPIVIGSLW